MKITMGLLMLVAGFFAHADGEKIYSCKIKEKKYIVQLSYALGENEIPARMKVSLDLNGQSVLLIAGAPIVQAEHNWTSEGSSGVRTYIIALSGSDANRGGKGYSLYLGTDGKVGLNSNEMWGAKDSDNCALTN